MTLTHEQYERIGRVLDGEELALSDAERAAADQIRRDEARIADMLAVEPPAAAIERAGESAMRAAIRRDEAALADLLEAPVPPQTLQRVHRRVVAELARPQRTLLRIGAVAASGAVAAAVLLAVTLSGFWPGGGGPRGALHRPEPPAVPVEVISASVQEPRDVAVELLAKEIGQLEADMLAAAPAELDLGIDQVEKALEELWLDLDDALE